MGYTWNCSSISFVREIDIRVTGTYGHLRYNLGNTWSSRLQDASIHGTKKLRREFV
jgi:hypothetical protein